MSIIIPNLSDIPDLSPVEEGEYDLRITKVKETKSLRTGRYGCQLIMSIVGEDNASDVFHTCWFGNFKDFQGDDDEMSTKMWRMTKEFMASLGVDPNEDINDDDLIGLEITAYLTYNDGMKEDDNGKMVKVGSPKNEIGRIL